MSVKITEKAIEEVKKTLTEQSFDPNEYVLRIAVAGGGCSGFQYSLTFEKENEIVSEDHLMSEQNGVKVALHKKSDLYLDGTTIDYYSGLEKRGFTFDNPNAVKSCGCNKSFNV